MKNLKILYTVSLVLLVGIANIATAQTDVIWIHGYNDNQSQWADYANLFRQERQMTTDNRRYWSNDDGVVAMAADVRGAINAGNTNNTIFVGHSLGGVAAAEADRGQGVRGIITFGSPIDGAHIANAVANGSVANETRYAVKEMTAGPKLQFHLLYVIATVANWAITGQGLGRLVEDEAVKALGLNRYSSQQTFRDLRTTSSYMTQKTFRSATPKISVWGNENSPVHYRLASSAATNGANDTKFVNATSVAKGIYLGFQRNNEIAGVIALVGGWWNPWSWGASAYLFYTASQWKRGKDYLGNSETSWKWLMGAYRYETTTYTSYEKIDCNDIMSRLPDLQDDCDEWRVVTYRYTRLIKESSDGFIARASQVGTRTTTWNPTQIEARGVNHMEMGTHPETERILRETWAGLHGGANSAQFIIPPR